MAAMAAEDRTPTPALHPPTDGSRMHLGVPGGLHGGPPSGPSPIHPPHPGAHPATSHRAISPAPSPTDPPSGTVPLSPRAAKRPRAGGGGGGGWDGVGLRV